MSIDEKINEALGISNDKPVTKAVVKKEYTPPVPRIEEKGKEDEAKDYKGHFLFINTQVNLCGHGKKKIRKFLKLKNL